MDTISNKKIIMLTINFFFLFFYFLDWSHFDQISINIRETVINFINNAQEQISIENNIPNRFDINDLNLSSSSLSLLSNISNDLNDDNNSSSNNLINLNNNHEQNTNRRRNHNNDQRSIFEELLGIFPY